MQSVRDTDAGLHRWAPGAYDRRNEEELKGAHKRYAALQACVDSKPLQDCVGELDVDIWMNVSIADRLGLS